MKKHQIQKTRTSPELFLDEAQIQKKIEECSEWLCINPKTMQKRILESAVNHISAVIQNAVLIDSQFGDDFTKAIIMKHYGIKPVLNLRLIQK